MHSIVLLMMIDSRSLSEIIFDVATTLNIIIMAYCRVDTLLEFINSINLFSRISTIFDKITVMLLTSLLLTGFQTMLV